MTSLVCVDASFIIRALGGHPLSEQAIVLLERWQRQQTTLIAPAHLDFEVTSTIRRFVYLKEFTPTQGEKTLEQFLRIKIRLASSRKLVPLAWKLAKAFNRPRAYDAFYIALAQMNGCEFWTADKRAYHTFGRELKWVRCLGNKE